MRSRRWRTLMAGLFWLLQAGLSLAQEAELHVEEGPWQAEVPVAIEVVAKGFEESPEPRVRVPAPPWGRLELVGVSPEISSSVQIINGQMSQWKSVRFSFHYRFVGDRTGSITLGPFHVMQDGKEATTRPVTLELGAIPTEGKDQRIILSVPEDPVYVGQRVPVRLQWWIEEHMVERLVGHEARVPLFEMQEAFGFEEVDPGKRNNAMAITSPSGTKKFAAETTKGTWDGRSWLVLTLDRVLIPLKEGDHAIPAASVILEEGVRWQRSFFGERTATRVRRLRVADTPRVLHVKPLPEAGRPPGFAGAIGQDFSLEVATERSVIQAGDPIHLTLTLKGEGSLATASLPPLARDEGGLPERDFRVPEGDVAGVVRDGVKTFEVMVRVLHEGVRELPPISYSWFDPKKGGYETTHSRPIALSVGAARKVSAEDVVRGATHKEEQPQPAPAPPQRESPAPAATDAPTTAAPSAWIGADLALERNVEKLLGGDASTSWFQMVALGGYVGGLGLIGIALWWRRKRQVDPELVRHRGQLHQLAQTVARAQTPRALADGLRRMAALVAQVPRETLDPLLETLDNLAFAPQGNKEAVPAELKSRAVAFARQMAGEGS
ncbi:MAG: BatD family protein [Magnetococcales bacterium]|nr:BatD family protein [Magnetococcales bacterium]